jgi:hypothetical protein
MTDAKLIARTQLANQNDASSNMSTVSIKTKKTPSKKSRKRVGKHEKRQKYIAARNAERHAPSRRSRVVVVEFACARCNKLHSAQVKVFSDESDEDARKYAVEEHWRSTHGMNLSDAAKWMRDHNLIKIPAAGATDPQSLGSTKIVNFEILPPGEWTVDKTIEQYRKNEEGITNKWNCTVDYDRIRQIYKLNPDRRYWGRASFFGYSVYEFFRYNKVILDCPIEGNAVYMLYKDRWKSQVLFSKKEIIDNFSGEFRKIVHKGDWLSRVTRELGTKIF